MNSEPRPCGTPGLGSLLNTSAPSGLLGGFGFVELFFGFGVLGLGLFC